MDSYKGGGEARRISVVYFLSRGGRTDQPHLFRVNLSHLHRAGVRLRDVKRWLSEVRGKDMPDNFSWSYKRKYKAGYVWQDLLDDDLITPISDNEYVLKGCDLRRTPPPPCSEAPKPFPIADEKKLNRKGGCERKQVEEELRVQVTRDYDQSSPKPPPPIDQDSPRSDNDATPFRIVLPQDLQQRKQRRQRESGVRSTATEQQQAVVLLLRPTSAMGGEKQQRPAVGNARRMRVAQVLHSILTCGAADAVDDAAHRPVAPRKSAGAIEYDDDDGWQRTPFCPGMDGCGISLSRKVKLQRDGKDSKAKRDGGRRDRVAAAHKPATLPRCSQCGKGFKPQELHSHMQSCRGLRERMRSSARPSVDRSRSSTAKADHSSSERPHTVFLLTES